MSQEGRNPDGTFAIGNQISKKDFTREMAQHAVKKEMDWTLAQMTRLYSEIEEEVKSGQYGKEQSFITVMMMKKAAKGDLSAMQWLVEMVVGKPKPVKDDSAGGEERDLGFNLISTKEIEDGN